VKFDLRFAGQYYDDETSTHYNINRDYDPKMGRYVQSDPIGFDGGVNSYGYVGGNPLVAVDELGLKKIDWFSSKGSTNQWFKTKAIPSIPDKKGWCLVFTHGEGAGIGLQYHEGYLTKGDDVKKKLILEGCTENMPVRLYACRTGRSILHIGGQLSKDWNSEVSAPILKLAYTFNNKLDGKEPHQTASDDALKFYPYADYLFYKKGKYLRTERK